MNHALAVAALKRSVRALDDDHRARLRRHLQGGTPICCGEVMASYFYLDGAG